MSDLRRALGSEQHHAGWFGRETTLRRICFHCGRKRADGLGPGISRRSRQSAVLRRRGSGAQINMVTKAVPTLGTARLPSTTNQGFEANDYFNNFATPVVGRQNLVRNQFGASFGGPIVKDKFFFFFDYNARRNATSTRLLRPCPRLRSPAVKSLT